MRHVLFSLTFKFLFFYAAGQSNLSVLSLKKKGDSLYYAGNYNEAITVYRVVAIQTDFRYKKANLFYNIGCCFSLQNDVDSAFYYLSIAVKNGYNNKDRLMADRDLFKLHNLRPWQKLLSTVKSIKTFNDDPLKAQFHTEDIHHFWTAFEKAMRDTAHFKSIFKQLYFNAASVGLKEYLGAKVGSMDDYISIIRSMPKYYASIKKNTLATDKMKPIFISIFQQVKILYPPSVFPDVYFLMGAFNAAGTVTPAGLLIGMDQESKDATIPLDELSNKRKAGLDDISILPLSIAHELIHYQQDGMKSSDTTLLAQSIIEGMADFLAELSGQSTVNLPQYKWAMGKEKFVWKRFKEEMYTTKTQGWIYLNDALSDDNPAMQGYWVGYQICKSFYEKADDKKKAIYDMLHIQDYKQFLEQSGWEKKIESNY